VRRATLVPIVVAAVLGAGWLNQGVSHARATAIQDSLHDPLHHPLDAGRFFLAELYERSGDEEINFAVARATRGLPYDADRLLHRGHDTPVSFDRAPAVDGRWHRPYVEVPFEYPIAMMPFVLLPSFLAGDTFAGFTRVFGALMTLLLLAAAGLTIPREPEPEARGRWWAFVLLLLAQGSLVVQRLDAVPALLLAWAFWAAARRRHATTGIALGLATASKFFPAFLVPLMIAADPGAWRTRRSCVRGALGLVGAATIGFLPMLFPPTALLDVLQYHSARGLQVESTGGVLLAFGHLFTGGAGPATLSFGSYNLDGGTAAWLARACTPLMFVLLAGVAVWFAKATPPESDTDRRDRLALAMLSGLATLWLSAKAFSPQYLTWAIPLVLAVSGKRGRTLTWLLFASLALTQTYMRAFYGQVIQGTAVGVGFLVARLPLLVTFAVVALRGALTASSPSGSSRSSAAPEPRYGT
jgi:hypothetical protein